MKPDRLLNRPCHVVRRIAGSEDEYGNQLHTETIIDTRCYAEQRRSTEPAGIGERALSDWLIVLPEGTEITNQDAVKLADEPVELEVIGDPWRAYDPRRRHVSQVECLARETQ